MVTECRTTVLYADHEREPYHEIKWTRGQEPRKRSLHLIASLAGAQRHVTVTFEGSLHSDRIARANARKRHQDLWEICECLDFNRLQLIDHTVSEILIKRKHDNTPPTFENDVASPSIALPLKSTPSTNSEYYQTLDQLRFCMREDPYHIHFPAFDRSSNTPTIDLSEITKTHQLSAGVYEAHVGEHGTRYVFKAIDRPLYEPRDSQILNQELQNLEMFLGVDGIVQLVAAVVSRNPYHTFGENCEAYESDDSNQTNETDQSDPNMKTPMSLVLRGVLLEYHPNGTLADALHGKQEHLEVIGAWRRWGLQIAEALARLHARGVTHMDLKPSNVLISAESNAVLGDVSGIGGVTRDYLAPEMLDVLDPLAEGITLRICNDIWALGKMIMDMGDASSDAMEKQQLKSIGGDATADDRTLRPALHEIISSFRAINS